MGYLDGKVALVVGGSGGIGAAICHRLASEGASCVVTWHTGKDAASPWLEIAATTAPP